MNKCDYTETPYDSLRIFIPVDKINPNDVLYDILNRMSVWNGCDSKNDEYYSWEFPKTETRFVVKITNLINGE